MRTEREPDRKGVRDDRKGVRKQAEYGFRFGGIGKKETERVGKGVRDRRCCFDELEA